MSALSIGECCVVVAMVIILVAMVIHNRRLDAVELFRSLPLHREALRVKLRSCTDLERALQKVNVWVKRAVMFSS